MLINHYYGKPNAEINPVDAGPADRLDIGLS